MQQDTFAPIPRSKVTPNSLALCFVYLTGCATDGSLSVYIELCDSINVNNFIDFKWLLLFQSVLQ